MNTHPRHDLVEALNHPVRFSFMAALSGVEALDFASLRDLLEVSDSVLSRQATQLEELGLIKVKKGYIGKRPRTWFSLTSAGRTSWEKHLNALHEIAQGGISAN
ncbi:MAG: transcriptional regulator [Actinomycetaceae bacterium]|nr:transcriptional regulator [Actinomycetaceae bacterium]